ncbi:MAG: hypothetical protein QOH72_1928 [Solirubrobacteraceae bacterium]|jgi:hypothetical protein|nr:hypothetical protein [Solirubrobacteraceae bacterium]
MARNRAVAGEGHSPPRPRHRCLLPRDETEQAIDALVAEGIEREDAQGHVRDWRASRARTDAFKARTDEAKAQNTDRELGDRVVVDG